MWFFLHNSTQNAVSQKGSLGFQTRKVLRNASPQTPSHEAMFSFLPSSHTTTLPASQTSSLWLSASVVPCLMSLLCADRQDGYPTTKLPLSQLSSCCRVQMLAALTSTPIGPLWIPAPYFEPVSIAEMQYHDWPGPSQALCLPWYLGMTKPSKATFNRSSPE